MGKAFYLDKQYELSLNNYQKSYNLNNNNSTAKKMIEKIKKTDYSKG